MSAVTDSASTHDRPIVAPTSGQDQPLAAVDLSQLVAVSLRLAMEVGALRERLHTHEALLVQHGLLTAGEVEAFKPSAQDLQQRLAEHRALIEALTRDIEGA